MKITGAVHEKRRQPQAPLALKLLDLARPRGEAEPRSPVAGVDARQGRRWQLPGIIEIQMKDRIGHCRHEEKTRAKARKRHRSSDPIITIAKQANNRKPKEEPDQPDIFCRVQDAFRVIARRTSAVFGTAWAFMAAVSIIVIWGATGHIFHYSDTWQLIINTGTTIVTFLMVFLIQNTQNRESRAIQLKLDELIIASTAGNEAVDLENISDKGATELLKQFHELAKRIQAR